MITQHPPCEPFYRGFKHGPKELCQLAVPWEYQRHSIGNGWAAEEKFDGIRLLWLGGHIVTREAEPFEAAEHLRPTLERLQRRAGKPMFFDCEFKSPGGFLATLAAFKRASDNRAGRAMLFDGFPLDQWRDGESRLDLYGRRRILTAIFDGWKPGDVELVTQSPAPSASRHIQNIAAGVWARGGEGLVLKRLDGRYTRARSADWLKVKRSLRIRATVLEVLHGGAAVRVDYQGRRLRIAVPPPLRAKMAPSIVGTDVMVEAMEWTEKGSLRQARVDAIETGKDKE